MLRLRVLSLVSPAVQRELTRGDPLDCSFSCSQIDNRCGGRSQTGPRLLILESSSACQAVAVQAQLNPTTGYLTASLLAEQHLWHATTFKRSAPETAKNLTR